jgi:hypothetical protein
MASGEAREAHAYAAPRGAQHQRLFLRSQVKVKEELRAMTNNPLLRQGKAIDVRQVGQELGVAYLLEDGVRRSREQLRITGHLVDAASRFRRPSLVRPFRRGSRWSHPAATAETRKRILRTALNARWIGIV